MCGYDLKNFTMSQSTPIYTFGIYVLVWWNNFDIPFTLVRHAWAWECTFNESKFFKNHWNMDSITIVSNFSTESPKLSKRWLDRTSPLLSFLFVQTKFLSGVIVTKKIYKAALLSINIDSGSSGIQTSKIWLAPPGEGDQELCLSGRRVWPTDPWADWHKILKQTRNHHWGSPGQSPWSW